MTLYMGRDKVESSFRVFPSTLAYSSLGLLTLNPDEDLIKYAWPQDIWFHVDKLSSAHVYLRMPESIPSWETIPEALLVDCAQLVKANSIEGGSHTLSNFPLQLEPELFQETSAMISRSYIPPQTI